MNKFNEMPPHSKVWVYQSARNLNAEEVGYIINEGNKFVEGWAAHGEPLKAAIEVLYDRFIVLMTDENQAQASGCSIDTSVHFFRMLDTKLNASLFDRTVITYKTANGVESCSMSEFDIKVQKGELNENTIVFNNMVSLKADFESKWEGPLINSWHKRYLPKKELLSK